MKLAFNHGDLDLVRLLMNDDDVITDAWHVEMSMCSLCFDDRIHIVEFLMPYFDPWYLSIFLLEAVKISDCVKLVEFLLDRGVEDRYNSISTAAGHGHLEIVKLFVSRGVKDYEHALEYAISRNQTHVIEYLKSIM